VHLDRAPSVAAGGHRTAPPGAGPSTLADPLGTDLAGWSAAFSAVLGRPVEVCRVEPDAGRAGKAHGMTRTVRVSVRQPDGGSGRYYLKVVDESLYGEALPEDRIREVVWRVRGYQGIPHHAGHAALAAIGPDGRLVPAALGRGDYCLVEPELPGRSYVDVLAAADPGALPDSAELLADYLVELHVPVAGETRAMYLRAVRDTLMNAAFRLIDGAPAYWDGQPERRRRVERRLADWRVRLAGHHQRLRRTHNDFHPWNILLDGRQVRVLGARSPGVGDPADDLAALAVNYLLFSYRRLGDFGGVHQAAFERFWNRYRERSGDGRCADVFAPFLAKRLLVLLNPVYYPDHPRWLVEQLGRLLDLTLDEEVDVLADPSRMRCR
jgi:hypothetical protein